ncbi:MAG: methionine--tRNA ligase [Nitrospiria bacterium]
MVVILGVRITNNEQRSTTNMPSYYITTPIYYVNDVPHIGHAYTTIAADVLARYHRLRGDEVFFLTGTDEHGQKVQQAAAKRGVSPQRHVDELVVRFQALWSRLDISNDEFVRTTQARHTAVVQAVLQRLQERGELEQRSYEGWYCLPDERFWSDDEVHDGACPDCGRPVERLSEQNYFFRMSRYRDRLIAHIASHPDFIRPESRRNEVLGFLNQSLGDLCISRPKSRLPWGVPFPFDDGYVTYVWVDALVNYISMVGYGTDDARFARYWPADVHLVGKDILTTHAVYWSTLLMALDLPLPRTIYAHGWWTVNAEKMSKSRGNVIDPGAVVDEFGVDPFRYFVLREVPFGQDGDFSREALIGRYNSDLANDLGNLLSRTLTMIERYAGGAVPARGSDDGFEALVAAAWREVDTALGDFQFHRALQEIFTVVTRANRYIESSAPWVLAKDPTQRERLNAVLYTLAETLRHVARMISPFMPGTAQAMWSSLGLAHLSHGGPDTWGYLPQGQATTKPPALFPRKTMDEQGTGNERTASPPASPEAALISIEDFAKIDLRVGKVLAAERVPKSSKLLKLQVDLGSETRQVLAGIGTRYEPETLVGRLVAVVANLKPAKLMGLESQGMILAAGDKEVASLIGFADPVQPGMKIK